MAGRLAQGLGTRALLVCGQGVLSRGSLLSQVKEAFETAGMHISLFAGVTGEADLAMVASGIRQLRSDGCDLVVGLGGGSAIDTAKAVAGLASQPGDLREYHTGRSLEMAGLPVIAIPTTAGTGAEVTRNAVLIDPETRLKQSIRGNDWFPRVALVDPLLTVSMDASLTAYTGSDALCQAIEAYTSIAANEITDSLAERAVSLITGNLARAHADGQDIAAREAMSMGSLLAGMAMAVARLGLVHGLAHPLGARNNIPHGLLCGLLLPHVMRYNLERCITKYARIEGLMHPGREYGGEERSAEEAIVSIERLLKSVGIPMRLAPLGVRPEDFKIIIQETMPSGSTKHNARPVSETDVRTILTNAL